jgi:hypothetical protein
MVTLGPVPCQGCRASVVWTDAWRDEETLELHECAIPREMTPDEWRKAQARKADQRRNARVKAAQGMGWAFPTDVPRGLGDRPGGRRAVINDVHNRGGWKQPREETNDD